MVIFHFLISINCSVRGKRKFQNPLGEVSTYQSYVWNSQDIKAIDKERPESSSKKIFYTVQTREVDKYMDGEELNDVHITNETDVMSVVIGRVICFRIFGINDY